MSRFILVLYQQCSNVLQKLQMYERLISLGLYWCGHVNIDQIQLYNYSNMHGNQVLSIRDTLLNYISEGNIAVFAWQHLSVTRVRFYIKTTL